MTPLGARLDHFEGFFHDGTSGVEVVGRRYFNS